IAPYPSKKPQRNFTDCSTYMGALMTDNVREQIATKLRMAREAAGLTQAQVAKMLQVHRPTISEIEAGRRRVPAAELTKLADIYGVSIEWITSERTSQSDPTDDRIMLAARQLSRMNDKDLDRLMTLIRMLRQPTGDKK